MKSLLLKMALDRGFGFWPGCLVLVFGAAVLTASPSWADYTFRGEVNFVEETIELNIRGEGESQVSLRTVPRDGEHYFTANFQNWTTPFFDLSTDMEGVVKWVHEEGSSPVLVGDIRSEYSLVDYQPVTDLRGGFRLRDRSLQLNGIRFGNLLLDGTVDWSESVYLNLAIELHEMGMADFISFWVDDFSADAAGPVNGKIKVSGALDHLRLEGRLESLSGYIRSFYFEKLVLNAAGVYPMLTINDSQLYTTDGMSFNVDGRFDLSQTGQISRQVQSLDITPMIRSDGQRTEWTIRRIDGDKSARTEIKYMLRSGEGSGSAGSPHQSDVLGFERSMSF